MRTMKLYEALHWASSFLEERGLEKPIAEILLKHFLEVDRSAFFEKMQDELPENVINHLEAALSIVAEGVPVQYITGDEQFYGRTFYVNRNVLIPRPETEELVQGVLERIETTFEGQSNIHVVDVGTGSGAIAITLALENKKLNVSSIDISDKALEVASKNSKNLNANVTFVEGDMLAPLIAKNKKVDVVVSNPPYISVADYEKLAPNVRNYEPVIALVGGQTGYEFYEEMMPQLPQVLNEKAIIAFEVGVNQTKTVAELIKNTFPNAKIEIEDDINGKDRMVFATLS